MNRKQAAYLYVSISPFQWSGPNKSLIYKLTYRTVSFFFERSRGVEQITFSN